MTETGEEKREDILNKVSIREILEAIKKEGMFISSDDLLMVKRSEVVFWVKMKAVQLKLGKDENVLLEIIFEQLDKLLLEDIKRRWLP